jgi:hypothetical protein
MKHFRIERFLSRVEIHRREYLRSIVGIAARKRESHLWERRLASLRGFMSRTERILRLMEEGTMTGWGVREAIAATEERRNKRAIQKHRWEGDELMGRPLMSHRPGRVERPKDTRSNRQQRVELIAPEVLRESLEKRCRAGTAADKIWLEKEL